MMKQDNVSFVAKNTDVTNMLKQQNVTTAHPTGIKRVGKDDVYNLEVKDTHNFIANGIVVHNSIDATRYILEVFKESNRSPVV